MAKTNGAAHETRRLVTKKGKAVDTPYTNEEALTALSERVSAGTAGDFGVDLYRKAGSPKGLSHDQMVWVHILVLPDVAGAGDGELFPRISTMFVNAAGQLRTPKVTFVIGAETVRISRAGSASRYSGDLWVTNGGSYGESVLYGRISAEDGVLHAREAMTQAVLTTLATLESDPAAAASTYGQETGNCCFCNKQLTTVSSLAVGYGPVCASHFNLPWGAGV